jgi:hypothetical protein
MNRKKYDEGYWDMIRISNDDKEYPTKMGQKWSNEEESTLLKELNENIDIEEIAQKHERTIGGIHARCRDIAYKMYLNNIPFEEITKQTKLNYDSILLTIEKKEQKPKDRDRDRDRDRNRDRNKKQMTPIDNVFISINKCDYTQLQTDVKNIKNDINQIKNTLGELVEMMKALYEFENS